DENPTRAFGQELRDDQSGFDRLSQTYFISQDAAAARYPLERKHHGVDLVGIRVDAALPLRSRLATALARRAKPDQVFGKVAAVDGMAEAFTLERRWHQRLPEIDLPISGC